MPKTGCCGSFIRVILGIVNTLFLVLGLAIFIGAAVLRWSSDSILNKITKNDDIRSIIDISALDNVSIALLVVGAFITVLSLIGLAGACCASKFFLFVYEIIIVLLFLFHAIVLIVAAFKSSDIETEFRKALNTTIADLNSPKTSKDDVTAKCKALKLISEIFECCGANGPQDFTLNTTYAIECCANRNYLFGCSDKTISTFKSNGVNLIVIPNSVILGFEFLIILLVPFLIGRISRSRASEEERIINVKPTNFNSTYRY